jgi:hypothetical protein
MCLRICWRSVSLCPFSLCRVSGVGQACTSGWGGRPNCPSQCYCVRIQTNDMVGEGGMAHTFTLPSGYNHHQHIQMHASLHTGEEHWAEVGTHQQTTHCTPFISIAQHTDERQVAGERGDTDITPSPPGYNHSQHVWYVHPYLTKELPATLALCALCPPPPPSTLQSWSLLSLISLPKPFCWRSRHEVRC